MDGSGKLRQQGQPAHAALGRLRDTLDALPDDRPSATPLVRAAAPAEAR